MSKEHLREIATCNNVRKSAQLVTYLISLDTSHKAKLNRLIHKSIPASTAFVVKLLPK